MDKLLLTDKKEIDHFVYNTLSLCKDKLDMHKKRSTIKIDNIVSPFAIRYMTGSDETPYAKYNGKIFLNSQYLAKKISDANLKDSEEMADEAQWAYQSAMREARLNLKERPEIKRDMTFDYTGQEDIGIRRAPRQPKNPPSSF